MRWQKIQNYSANCIPSEECRVTEYPLPAPPRPPRVGLPPLPGCALKSADSLLAPPYINTSNERKVQYHYPQGNLRASVCQRNNATYNLTSFFLSRLLLTSWKWAAPSRPKHRNVSTVKKIQGMTSICRQIKEQYLHVKNVRAVV